jgi:hypothetical protein
MSEMRTGYDKHIDLIRASAVTGHSVSRVLLDPPTIPDLHWRGVRARHSESKDLAGIWMPSVPIAASEADVEGLGEQQDVQKPDGVNFGMETFHSHLVLRHEIPPDPLRKFNWISRFVSQCSWPISIQQSIA